MHAWVTMLISTNFLSIPIWIQVLEMPPEKAGALLCNGKLKEKVITFFFFVIEDDNHFFSYVISLVHCCLDSAFLRESSILLPRICSAIDIILLFEEKELLMADVFNCCSYVLFPPAEYFIFISLYRALVPLTFCFSECSKDCCRLSSPEFDSSIPIAHSPSSLLVTLSWDWNSYRPTLVIYTELRRALMHRTISWAHGSRLSPNQQASAEEKQAAFTDLI